MASITPSRPGGIIEGINMTPLVDIMLVLLVIFMVTAKIGASPAVPMDLPKASQAEDVQVIFAVSISKSGTVHVNGRAIANDEALLTLSRAAVAKDEVLRAVIQADGEVPHARVIHTLDLMRQAGLQRVAFATAPLPARGEAR